MYKYIDDGTVFETVSFERDLFEERGWQDSSVDAYMINMRLNIIIIIIFPLPLAASAG